MGKMTALPLHLTDESTGCCSLGSGPLDGQQATHYAALFKVLADPARLQLLSQLTAADCRPASVSDLTELSGLSQPTVSHHLKKLTDSGLVEKVRVGRTITHEVRPEIFTELRTVLQMD